MKLQKAKLRWFDAMAGEGMVRLEDGSCVFVHFTAIQDDRMTSDNYAYPSKHDQDLFKVIMTNNVDCQVEVYQDENYSQVSKLYLK